MKPRKRVFDKGTGSTSVSPVLDIHSVLTHITVNTISLPILIKKSESESVKTLALIDSGSGGNSSTKNMPNS